MPKNTSPTHPAANNISNTGWFKKIGDTDKLDRPVCTYFPKDICCTLLCSQYKLKFVSAVIGVNGRFLKWSLTVIGAQTLILI